MGGELEERTEDASERSSSEERKPDDGTDDTASAAPTPLPRKRRGQSEIKSQRVVTGSHSKTDSVTIDSKEGSDIKIQVPKKRSQPKIDPVDTETKEASGVKLQAHKTGSETKTESVNTETKEALGAKLVAHKTGSQPKIDSVDADTKDISDIKLQGPRPDQPPKSDLSSVISAGEVAALLDRPGDQDEKLEEKQPEVSSLSQPLKTQEQKQAKVAQPEERVPSRKEKGIFCKHEN